MTSIPENFRAMGRLSVARRLAVQALYGWQLNKEPWQDLLAQFAAAEDMPKADGEYFETLLRGVCTQHEELDAALGQWLDRPVAQLDPVEHAVLLLGVLELRDCIQVPYRVVLNEAINLTKRFGATDGHKFVNAVLDRAARELRAREH